MKVMTQAKKRWIERSRRMEVERSIYVSTFGSPLVYKVHCKNLSASGFMFIGNAHQLPFQPGTIIESVFRDADFESEESVKITGKVVRMEKEPEVLGTRSLMTSYGIQISFLDASDLNAWYSFLENVIENNESVSS